MDEAKLESVADRCARFILFGGTRTGVSSANLAQRIDAYRDLGDDERLRVQVMLCKKPSLASTAFGNSFRFYPRPLAPPEAFSTP